MKTRFMNERITFFEYVSIQTDDGEVIPNDETELFSCWAEVTKSTIKEFKERSNIETGESLEKRRTKKTFLIRHRYEETVDTSMFVKFRGDTYEVKDIEPDYRNKDFDLVSVELIA